VFERESDFFSPAAGELPGGDGNAAFVGVSPLLKRSRIARWCFPGAQLLLTMMTLLQCNYNCFHFVGGASLSTKISR